jgi:hypothetical protein
VAENVTHRHRRQCQEVAAALHFDPSLAMQFDVRFVNERSRAEGVIAKPPAALSVRDHAKVFIQHGCERIQIGRVCVVLAQRWTQNCGPGFVSQLRPPSRHQNTTGR